jgi:PPOX class probable F420-dependent enzyme
VLATVHPSRGVDAVPVVYALHGAAVVVPVDTVKPKSSTSLRRLANLEADPRCALLVEHYDDDWSALWWVRLHATARVVERGSGELERLIAPLARRFPPYGEAGSVVGAIVLQPARRQGRGAAAGVSGWAAS